MGLCAPDSDLSPPVNNRKQQEEIVSSQLKKNKTEVIQTYRSVQSSVTDARARHSGGTGIFALPREVQSLPFFP